MKYPFSRSVARRSRSNFYPAFFFLSPVQREAILAVYAFSRLVDDAVDQADLTEAGDPGKARGELEEWKRRLDRCYDAGSAGGTGSEGGPPSHPLIPELADAVRRFAIPRTYFSDLLAGVEMDLTRRRYETFGELEVYCHRVAGTVGLICNRIFGAEGEAYRAYAISLGTAFQLTNILRDVGSDLANDRVYLPLEDLRRFSYSLEDLQKRVRNERFLHLMRFEAARARWFFEEAERILAERERRRLLPAWIMSRFYEGILTKLEKTQFPSLRRKVGLSLIAKSRIVGGCWLRSRLCLRRCRCLRR